MRFKSTACKLAEEGNDGYQSHIAQAFRRQVVKDLGFDPGWIDYDRLKITPTKKVAPVP